MTTLKCSPAQGEHFNKLIIKSHFVEGVRNEGCETCEAFAREFTRRKRPNKNVAEQSMPKFITLSNHRR